MTFGGPVTPKPLNRFPKLGVSEWSHRPPNPRGKFGCNRFKGGVAAHARNSPLAVYFFCSRLQVCMLNRQTPLMAQT